jgi:hypothetical protein
LGPGVANRNPFHLRCFKPLPNRNPGIENLAPFRIGRIFSAVLFLFGQELLTLFRDDLDFAPDRMPRVWMPQGLRVLGCHHLPPLAELTAFPKGGRIAVTDLEELDLFLDREPFAMVGAIAIRIVRTLNQYRTGR